MSQILLASARPRKPSTSNVSPAVAPSRSEICRRSSPRHLLLDLEADHLPAAALPQRGLELDHEVGRFVVDFDFAVADDAEGARADDVVAGEHLVEEEVDQRVDGHDLDPPLGHEARPAA